MYVKKQKFSKQILDIIALLIAVAVAFGVYGLFLLNGQGAIGTFFAIIIFFGVCFLEYCLASVIKEKVKGIGRKKYTKPQVQKRISFDEFKYCIKCGSEMKKDLKICTKCGQPFQV